jgi:hypothetical protein
VRFDKTEHLQTILAGQVKVQNNKVESALLQFANGQFDRAHGRYNVSLMVEIESQHLAKRGFVINKQNLRLHTAFFARFRPERKSPVANAFP